MSAGSHGSTGSTSTGSNGYAGWTPAQLRAEASRVRVSGDRLGVALWVVAGGALVFTCLNVTTFAVVHGTPWWIAWLLDPMTSLALLVVLVGDGVLARHGRRGGAWAGTVKIGAACATWTMNVWASVAGRDAAGVVLHSIAPALVVGLAEITPRYRAAFADLAADLANRAEHLETVPTTSTEATATPTGSSTSIEPATTSIEPAATRTGSSTSTVPATTSTGLIGSTSGRGRSLVTLRAQLAAAIEAGRLPGAPSAEAVRRELGIAPATARLLRDELAAAPAAGGKGDPAPVVVDELAAHRSLPVLDAAPAAAPDAATGGAVDGAAA